VEHNETGGGENQGGLKAEPISKKKKSIANNLGGHQKVIARVNQAIKTVVGLSNTPGQRGQKRGNTFGKKKKVPGKKASGWGKKTLMNKFLMCENFVLDKMSTSGGTQKPTQR